MSEPPILTYASAQPMFVPFLSGHRLANWTIGLIIVRLVLALSLVGVNVVQLSLVTQYRNQKISLGMMLSHPRWVTAINGAHSVVAFAAFIAFFIWLYRVYRNLPALGAISRFTPAWAVGWWFVPIMNIVRPYQIMANLWRGSHSIDGERHRTSLVQFWWSSYLILTFASAVVDILISVAIIGPDDELEYQIWHGIGALSFTLVPGLLIIAIIRRIDRAQAARAQLPINP